MTLQTKIALDFYPKLKRLKDEWSPAKAIKQTKYPHTRQQFHIILRILVKKKMVKKVYYGHYKCVDMV